MHHCASADPLWPSAVDLVTLISRKDRATYRAFTELLSEFRRASISMRTVVARAYGLIGEV